MLTCSTNVGYLFGSFLDDLFHSLFVIDMGKFMIGVSLVRALS
jgi:hypothetical protein